MLSCPLARSHFPAKTRTDTHNRCRLLSQGMSYLEKQQQLKKNKQKELAKVCIFPNSAPEKNRITHLVFSVFQVDHKTMDYLPLRKNFYVESSIIAQWSQEEVSTAVAIGCLLIAAVLCCALLLLQSWQLVRANGRCGKTCF